MKYLETFGKSRILVIDNSKPPQKKYLQEVIKYLTNRNIEFVVANSIEAIETCQKEFPIIGAISTGSDYRVEESDFSELSDYAMEHLDCPILGLCFGFQSMAKYYGSTIISGDEKCGKFSVNKVDSNFFMFRNQDLRDLSFCFHDFPESSPRGFKVICELDGVISGISNESIERYGLLFHPEEQIRTHPILDSFIGKCLRRRIKNYHSFPV